MDKSQPSHYVNFTVPSLAWDKSEYCRYYRVKSVSLKAERDIVKWDDILDKILWV